MIDHENKLGDKDNRLNIKSKVQIYVCPVNPRCRKMKPDGTCNMQCTQVSQVMYGGGIEENSTNSRLQIE